MSRREFIEHPGEIALVSLEDSERAERGDGDTLVALSERVSAGVRVLQLEARLYGVAPCISLSEWARLDAFARRWLEEVS